MAIDRWTGHEARLLREAVRLSQREFAAILGIAPRTVAQWDRIGVGITPRPEFQRMLDVALQRAPQDAVGRFGEAIRRATQQPSTVAAMEQSGVEGEPPEASEFYPLAANEALDAITGLWRSDLLDVGQLMGAGAEPAAWDEASLRWLVAPPDGPVGREDRDGVRVGQADIRAVRTTVNVFAKLDNTFGGNHARRSLIQFLASDVARLLRGRFDDTTGRALHQTVAEASLLAGWMSYDAGHHGLAQQYLLRALRLAQSADDAQLAGSVLSAMSHQATYLGHYREAIDLAQSAIAGTRTVATATLTVQFLAMQARALACLGDKRRCELALLEAERVFERRHPSDDPEFITYFTEAELAAEVAHCMRDLGQAEAAITNAELSLDGSDGEYVRSDFFATMVLAHAQLDAREPEQACRTVLSALDLGQQLHSARCVTYVYEFRKRLPQWADTRVVRELSDAAADSSLWIAAA